MKNLTLWSDMNPLPDYAGCPITAYLSVCLLTLGALLISVENKIIKSTTALNQ